MTGRCLHEHLAPLGSGWSGLRRACGRRVVEPGPFQSAWRVCYNLNPLAYRRDAFRLLGRAWSLPSVWPSGAPR
eukprot:CAMPEP_0181234702 /NCGR_PEP_ID=MMETSP1096-20121128/37126_1 /TAXON_ID=156174 ORGANISM="Chrysochromulina ericina, Strain CCMP281" /NCGR_SAMPLE_ID=MMETSP1096 /ASSEMBLY_ACC=CAM_ASM_000453 /LENGTH=73 /DNA_ID=CAMNT_0023329519 /DNA_START=533 /DNA_END=750 /DNA_ORIENTATION=+